MSAPRGNIPAPDRIVTAPVDNSRRRWFRRAAVILIILGSAWTLLLFGVGGVEMHLFGQTITSHGLLRPLAMAAAGLTLLLIVDGVRRTYEQGRAVFMRLDDRLIAGTLAAMTFAIGVAYASTAAAGADSYGYVSQADLWIAGHLKIDQAWVADVPWPNAKWSFAPLGYRPIAADGSWSIVPTYSPGLPLMMAFAKVVAGHCAMFLIVPIFGAVLVLATFGIGDRLGSRRAGLIGAWLVATSPSMLFHLVEPLTDVPVAGAWAAAFYCLLGSGSYARLLRVGPGSGSHARLLRVGPGSGARSALAAGALAGLAILIRPNLVALAGVMGLWYVMRLGRDDGMRGRALGYGVLFSLGVAPGIVAVALFNQHLYGSAFTSGYGRLGEQFVSARIWPNLVHYLGWLVQSHTPIVLTGLVAIFVPLRLFWPHVRDRWIFLIAGLFVATVWGIYCAYIEFDAWWYLRFLLPSWPFMMVGVGAVALALARAGGSTVRLLVIGVVVAVGVVEIQWTVRQGAFDTWQGERRYPSVARHVSRLTPENSVILSMQHSGSLRYYGGRMTLRYDQIERDWIDRAIAWLAARGVETYLLVEDRELPSIRERFAGTRALAALDAAPVLIYDWGGRIQLFDLSGEGGLLARHVRIRETFKDLRCVPPAPLPRLVLK
jgi:hypothetical protein